MSDSSPPEPSSTRLESSPNHRDGRQCAHLRVSRALRDATTLGDATIALLEAAIDEWDWSIGALWLVDAHGGLTCFEVVAADGVRAPAVEEMTWGLEYESGYGMPGRALATGKPVTISVQTDVLTDVARTHPRAAVGLAEGLQRGIDIPLRRGGTRTGQIFGVIEFFGRPAEEVPSWMVDEMDVLCAQLGRWAGDRALRGEMQHERAVEIQEELVELLWLAQTALDIGQVDQAAKLVSESVTIARRIGEMVGSQDQRVV